MTNVKCRMSNEGILSILNFGLQNADRLSLGRGLSVRKSEMVYLCIDFGVGVPYV